MLFFQCEVRKTNQSMKTNFDGSKINHKKNANYMYGLVNWSKQYSYRKSGRFALVKSKIFKKIEFVY